MEKLRDILEKIFDDGKLPKNITPYMAGRLYDIYNSLISGREESFIEAEINDILSKCGIKTRIQGVGWIAYR